MKNLAPLPPGWEMRNMPDGRQYFVDHNTRSTTFIGWFPLSLFAIPFFSPAPLNPHAIVRCNVRPARQGCDGLAHVLARLQVQALHVPQQVLPGMRPDQPHLTFTTLAITTTTYLSHCRCADHRFCRVVPRALTSTVPLLSWTRLTAS